MLREWIKDKLLRERDRQRHDVIKLQWQKAELETLLAKHVMNDCKKNATPE